MFLYLVLTFCAGTYTASGLNHIVVFTITFGFNLSEVFKVLWTFYILCLVGRPSVSTLSLTPFERSYSVSVASPYAVVWRSYACRDMCV